MNPLENRITDLHRECTDGPLGADHAVVNCFTVLFVPSSVPLASTQLVPNTRLAYRRVLESQEKTFLASLLNAKALAKYFATR